MLQSFWGPVTSLEPSATRFTPHFRPSSLPLPPLTSPLKICIAHSSDQLEHVCRFLESNFGNPPKTPTLSPDLLSHRTSQIVIYIQDTTTSEIVASIRYKYAGHFEKKQISLVDCFCIAPEWRKKGLGTYLLTALHNYAMSLNIGFCLFLKESAPQFTFIRPFYSSSYLFTKVKPLVQRLVQTMQTPQTIQTSQANAIIRAFTSIYPDTFILMNISPEQQKTIHWRFFRSGSNLVLASFQDSGQIHTDGGKIGWCTGCLQTAFPNKIQVIDEIVDSLPFDWVWIDRVFINDTSRQRWKEDGQFHWYTYQWSTCLNLGDSYILHI